jgi:hypothetical protein
MYAEVGLDISVYLAGRPATGQPVYYRYVKSEFFDDVECRRWGGKRANAVLEDALEDAMKKLFADPKFIQALLDPSPAGR